ncbi:MAG TPA: hypothetical protein VEJ20_01105 [Candidatus Eremiobacteraceae bacterium]|nr:hypothetical protein [Candidatus Eremiobacteraceae bacterium]
MIRLFALLSTLLAPTATPSPAPAVPDQLFSRRALRQARLLIEMRMMQLRDERLECVREALLRRLPEALRPEPPSPRAGSLGRQIDTNCDFFSLPE